MLIETNFFELSAETLGGNAAVGRAFPINMWKCKTEVFYLTKKEERSKIGLILLRSFSLRPWRRGFNIYRMGWRSCGPCSFETSKLTAHLAF